MEGDPAKGAAVGAGGSVDPLQKAALGFHSHHPLNQPKPRTLGVFRHNQIPRLGGTATIGGRVNQHLLPRDEQGAHGISGDAKSPPPPPQPQTDIHPVARA